jgi:hypothetical protein
MSNGATGSSSELFEMDMREDIVYQYTARPKNENGIFNPRIDTDSYRDLIFSPVFQPCKSVA